MALTRWQLTPDVTYEQLKRIGDWQLTEEAQRGALAELVGAIAGLDTSSRWGEGRTAASDGQRFALPRRVLQQTYSTRFSDFALEFYTFVADNYAPFYSLPIECTDRDAAFVLDGLLYNESELEIEEHYTDTHGYTETNFAASPCWACASARASAGFSTSASIGSIPTATTAHSQLWSATPTGPSTPRSPSSGTAWRSFTHRLTGHDTGSLGPRDCTGSDLAFRGVATLLDDSLYGLEGQRSATPQPQLFAKLGATRQDTSGTTSCSMASTFWIGSLSDGAGGPLRPSLSV